MVANEGKNSEDDEENNERGELAARCVISNPNPIQKGAETAHAYLKAERGGGGGFGTDDPPQRPMVAVAIAIE